MIAILAIMQYTPSELDIWHHLIIAPTGRWCALSLCIYVCFKHTLCNVLPYGAQVFCMIWSWWSGGVWQLTFGT